MREQLRVLRVRETRLADEKRADATIGTELRWRYDSACPSGVRSRAAAGRRHRRGTFSGAPAFPPQLRVETLGRRRRTRFFRPARSNSDVNFLRLMRLRRMISRTAFVGDSFLDCLVRAKLPGFTTEDIGLPHPASIFFLSHHGPLLFREAAQLVPSTRLAAAERRRSSSAARKDLPCHGMSSCSKSPPRAATRRRSSEPCSHAPRPSRSEPFPRSIRRSSRTGSCAGRARRTPGRSGSTRSRRPGAGSSTPRCWSEIQTSLAGVAELRSSAAYADLSLPAPGLDPARARGPGRGPLVRGPRCPGLGGSRARLGRGGGRERAARGSHRRDRAVPRRRAGRAGAQALGRRARLHRQRGQGSPRLPGQVSRRPGGEGEPRRSAEDPRLSRAPGARGRTAAINTYDDQIVTWGTGWGGRGWLGQGDGAGDRELTPCARRWARRRPLPRQQRVRRRRSRLRHGRHRRQGSARDPAPLRPAPPPADRPGQEPSHARRGDRGPAPHVHGWLGQHLRRRRDRDAGAVQPDRAPQALGARVRDRVSRVGRTAARRRVAVRGSRPAPRRAGGPLLLRQGAQVQVDPGLQAVPALLPAPEGRRARLPARALPPGRGASGG